MSFSSLRRPSGSTVVYALVVIALLGQIPLLQRSVRLLGADPANDPVSTAETHLAELRVMLERTTRAGYVTDIPGDSIGTDPLATERYFQTQYVLAPVVLERGTAERLVIGNFASGHVPPPYGHLRILRDFGSGLVLLEGADR